VIADGVQVLVKEVSLFSAEFDEKLKALQSSEAKASEMEHAIRHEIHIRLEEDPAYFQSLRARLEQIIADRRARRIGEAEQLSLLQNLINETRGHAKAADDVGMTETGFAIFGLLKGAGASRAAESRATYGDDHLREVTSAIEIAVAPHVAIVDWSKKADVQREMRRQIKRRLPPDVYGRDEQERLAAALIDLLKVRKGR
jgi:type I restriction enzyme R subunit